MIQFNVEFRGKGAMLKELAAIKSGIERRKVLRLLADEAVELIKTRTLAGRDENDKALIPSKRAGQDNGQTLSDKGHMLGSMCVLSVGTDRAVIGFGDLGQSKKAWWAQDGTVPHVISAKNGKALAFKASMSTATHMMGGKNKETGRRKLTRVTMGNARSGARGMTVVQHVHHPGTPKRPFFGVSPKDSIHLKASATAYLKDLIAEAQR